MKRKTIRGCGGDRVTLVRAPDPLDEPLGRKPVDIIHVTAQAKDGSSWFRASTTSTLTLAGAKRLHAALGSLLAPKRRRRGRG